MSGRELKICSTPVIRGDVNLNAGILLKTRGFLLGLHGFWRALFEGFHVRGRE